MSAVADLDVTDTDVQRADEARRNLIRDIREIKKLGNKMIDNTESAVHKAPLILVGVLGVALVGVAVFASRRSKPRFPGLPRERSFLAEAARSAALSALGILSGRLTQRLLASATMEPPRQDQRPSPLNL